MKRINLHSHSNQNVPLGPVYRIQTIFYHPGGSGSDNMSDASASLLSDKISQVTSMLFNAFFFVSFDRNVKTEMLNPDAENN